MALNLIKKVASAPLGKGRVATEPMVAVAENGQVRLNKLATAALGDATYLVLNKVDENGRDFQFIGLANLPKDWAKSDAIEPKKTDKDGKAVDAWYFSFAGTLREIGYNFKESGNQTFKAIATEVKVGKTVLKAITFTLPEGAIEKRAVTPRKKKVSAIAPTPVAKAAAATAQAEDDAASEDLTL